MKSKIEFRHGIFYEAILNDKGQYAVINKTSKLINGEILGVVYWQSKHWAFAKEPWVAISDDMYEDIYQFVNKLNEVI